jgi:hypothetical protein
MMIGCLKPVNHHFVTYSNKLTGEILEKVIDKKTVTRAVCARAGRTGNKPAESTTHQRRCAEPLLFERAVLKTGIEPPIGIDDGDIPSPDISSSRHIPLAIGLSQVRWTCAWPSKTGRKATAINHVSYGVPDYRRTRDFYVDLFGMRIVIEVFHPVRIPLTPYEPSPMFDPRRSGLP